MQIIAGIDLGGTAINLTFVNEQEQFLLDGLCEYPARADDGPTVCLRQIEEGLKSAARQSWNFLFRRCGGRLGHTRTGHCDGRTERPRVHQFCSSQMGGVRHSRKSWNLLGKPVTYLNDGNAAALWGHFALFGADNRATSISTVIGTGLGGGVIADGNVLKGRRGFGGELGHVLIPWTKIPGISELSPRCNCWRTGDLESLCSLTAIENNLLPFFLSKYPNHELGRVANVRQAALMVRGRAEQGDAMCRDIFRVQAQALGLFFDEMVNIFDPDVLMVGGGALETKEEFRRWFVDEIRAGMPIQREEQIDIPIYVMPNGDTAGARGAAIEALKFLREMRQGVSGSMMSRVPE